MITRKFHYTQKRKIRQLFSAGFSIDELMIMYNSVREDIRVLVKHITPPERI